ncbi:dihydrofolate reductase family protein [Curtobacterium ammoniigenes]|uniref:dihydrofolate reductase family protein n=1 Tax=Curtobacterium ammoniigenes TaxID=395387 RepID=UPI00082FB1FE|nr:dihydrofolate reductase family protein [Curtobacterium ammoniigenes]
MRTLTAGLFTSVDGVVEDPSRFQLDSFDAELAEGMGTFMGRTSTVILGRRSYDEWAGHWPTHPDDPFAGFINPIEKIVVSNTLHGDLAWQNSRLLDGELIEAVRELKAGDGADIAVCGSISIVRQLVFAGLLDELQLMIHPVIAGPGRRLFEPTDPMTRLRLVRSTVTSKGNVLSTYGPHSA